MTWIIILSIFIIVGLFFCGLFAGKLSTYKRVPKLVQDYISRDNTLNFEAFKGGVSLKEDGPSFGTFILSYLVLMALIFLVGTFCDWKNELLKNFEDGQYVRVASVTRYAPTDSTRYEKTYDIRYIKRDKFEKKVQSGEVEERK